MGFLLTTHSKRVLNEELLDEWWIVFLLWLTRERGYFPFFPTGNIARALLTNLRHSVSRVWTCAKLEYRLSWLKLKEFPKVSHSGQDSSLYYFRDLLVRPMLPLPLFCPQNVNFAISRQFFDILGKISHTSWS